MKSDQERVSALLTETVLILCQKGLKYSNELKVQGTLGITVDENVFIVHFNERFNDVVEETDFAKSDSPADANNASSNCTPRHLNEKEEKPQFDSFGAMVLSSREQKNDAVDMKPDVLGNAGENDDDAITVDSDAGESEFMPNRNNSHGAVSGNCRMVNSSSAMVLYQPDTAEGDMWHSLSTYHGSRIRQHQKPYCYDPTIDSDTSGYDADAATDYESKPFLPFADTGSGEDSCGQWTGPSPGAYRYQSIDRHDVSRGIASAFQVLD